MGREYSGAAGVGQRRTETRAAQIPALRFSKAWKILRADFPMLGTFSSDRLAQRAPWLLMLLALVLLVPGTATLPLLDRATRPENARIE